MQQAKRSIQKRLKLGPKAMSELVKPARLEIYESLQLAGPSSIADLALRLGRPADSLYYHVRKLLKIGVIEERVGQSPQRAGPGPKGSVYSVVARMLDVELDPTSRTSRKAWAEGGAAVLRLAGRDYGKALESDRVRPEGSQRNLMIRRSKVRLDAAQLKELNQHLDALNDLLYKRAENTEGELHAVTLMMTHLEERNLR